MAKGDKAKQRQQRSRGLERDKFDGFINSVASARQKLTDANMAHAGEWKNADALGIHRQAAKLYLHIDTMGDTKRADFLRNFDRYRKWSDWDDQPDMLDQADEAESTTEREQPPLVAMPGIGDDEREPSEPAPLDFEDKPPVESPPKLEEPEVEADPVDETAAQVTEEMAGAGFTFADGKDAAIKGRPADSNPHIGGSPSHSIWVRGYEQGVRDRDGDSGPQDDGGDNVEPIGTGRRARRGAEAPASVH